MITTRWAYCARCGDAVEADERGCPYCAEREERKGITSELARNTLAWLFAFAGRTRRVFA